MKALKLLVLTILTLSSAALANVDKVGKNKATEVEAQIFSHDDDMVFVQLQNPVDSKLQLTIADQNGVILHKEIIKKDLKVLKRYDVSNLPAGLYSYKVSGEAYTVIKKIEKE